MPPSRAPLAQSVRKSRNQPIEKPLNSKARTGIRGLDDITDGGLPRARTSLVCGSAGCGKTLLAMEFLVRGAKEFGEPGIFVSFEESDRELMENFNALGFDLSELIHANKIMVDFVRVQRDEFDEIGEYNLDGLFIRLNHAIDTIGAKRIVLDTIETLFSGLANTALVRSELVRLFRFLKDKGVTAIVTGERGEGTLTRNGLEEYVSDCVILLDHRVHEQISTRRLRVVKYRGSTHGTNEYPFVIDDHGISVLPVTSLGLTHKVSEGRVSSGIPRMDEMLGGGPYRGSSVLISGTAGTGKTTISCHFAAASARRGERCLYFAFEESGDQICRNMLSVGLDLRPLMNKDLLRIHSTRPSLFGLEQHLVTMHRQIEDFKPAFVVVDPVSSLINAGTSSETNAMLLRLVDHLKMHNVTAVFTSLNHGGSAGANVEGTELSISSLMDTWILLRDIELGGERNRGIYVLKSRGSFHSNQIREYRMSRQGIELIEVYTGPEGVLTGSARLAQEARMRTDALRRVQESKRMHRELERRRRVLEAKIAALHAEFEAEGEEYDRLNRDAQELEADMDANSDAMSRSRRVAKNLRDSKVKVAKRGRS